LSKKLTVLGTNTSGATAQAAVVRGTEVLSNKSDDTPFAQERMLEQLVAAALKEAGASLKTIDGVAACIGPGSLTGSRLALAAARAYKVALGTPVVGVNSLEALAMPLLKPERLVVAAVDARRGEVYAAAFRDGQIPVEVAPPQRCKPEELIKLAAGAEAIFAGDGVLRYRNALPAGAEIAAPELCIVSAACIALIGEARLKERPEGDSFVDLTPLYLRRSDRELRLDREPPKS